MNAQQIEVEVARRPPEHWLAKILFPVLAAVAVNVLILAYSLGQMASRLDDLSDEVRQLREKAPPEAQVKMSANESRILALERDFGRLLTQLDRIEAKIDRHSTNGEGR